MPEQICPHCGKPIYDDEALLCLYCGENLNRGVGFLGKMKYSVPWVAVCIVVITVVSFIILIVM